MQGPVTPAGAGAVSGASCGDGGQLVTPVAVARERPRHNKDAGGAGGREQPEGNFLQILNFARDIFGSCAGFLGVCMISIIS